MNMQIKGSEAHIYLYGVIDKYDISANDLIQNIHKAETLKTKSLHVHVNCPGGDVFEGIAMIQALISTKLPVIIHIDGIAASMAAAVVMNKGFKRIIGKYARLMTHKVKGGAFGTADELDNAANVIRSMDDDLANVFSELTGLSVDKAREKYLGEHDKYITASEALKDGIVDEVDDNVKVKPAQDFQDYNKLYGEYRNKLETKTPINMDKIIAVIGLKADATQDDVISAWNKQKDEVSTKNQEITTLKNQLKDYQEKETALKEKAITDLVDNAITDKKITAAQKDTFVALAKADFDNAKKVIDEMPSGKIDLPAGGSNDKRNDWTFSDYHQKDPKALEEMMANNKEQYKALYKAQYGKEPEL